MPIGLPLSTPPVFPATPARTQKAQSSKGGVLARRAAIGTAHAAHWRLAADLEAPREGTGPPPACLGLRSVICHRFGGRPEAKQSAEWDFGVPAGLQEPGGSPELSLPTSPRCLESPQVSHELLTPLRWRSSCCILAPSGGQCRNSLWVSAHCGKLPGEKALEANWGEGGAKGGHLF